MVNNLLSVRLNRILEANLFYICLIKRQTRKIACFIFDAGICVLNGTWLRFDGTQAETDMKCGSGGE